MSADKYLLTKISEVKTNQATTDKISKDKGSLCPVSVVEHDAGQRLFLILRNLKPCFFSLFLLLLFYPLLIVL